MIKKIVTLLKAENLTKEEIIFYNNEYYSENGEYPYLKNENCNSNNQSGCDYNYINSGIKQIIDSWARKYSNDLVSIYGYDARVINSNELYNIGFSVIPAGPPEGYWIEISGNKLSWAIIDNKSYWPLVSYPNPQEKYIISENPANVNLYDTAYIRPVINLKKCALNKTCE